MNNLGTVTAVGTKDAVDFLVTVVFLTTRFVKVPMAAFAAVVTMVTRVFSSVHNSRFVAYVTHFARALHDSAIKIIIVLRIITNQHCYF